MTNVKDFVEQTIDSFRENLTDALFLFIENDRELMQQYLDLMEKGSTRKEINTQLAKQLKSRMNLSSQPVCSARPRSSLITTTYLLHE